MTRPQPWRAAHPTAVVVARPTLLGNPFRVIRARQPRGAPQQWHLTDTAGNTTLARFDARSAAHTGAVTLFRSWLHTGRLPDLQSLPPEELLRPLLHHIASQRREIWARLPTLYGRDLACWCPLELSCHADEYLNITKGVRER